MLEWLNAYRDISMSAIAVRMCLCVLCGGIIGLEREVMRRPAGFRTHILVCLGAAMTTMTGEFLLLYMHYHTDVGRIGAQVVAGIGFLGAGTIITRREKVSGLTTAAGLWAAAIIGLAIGAGFYEGAVLATVLVELAELLFSKLERGMLANSSAVSVYVEYNEKEALNETLDYLRTNHIKLTDMQITRSKINRHHNACALLTVNAGKRLRANRMMADIRDIKGITLLEEL